MEQIIKLVLNLFESFLWIDWEVDSEFKLVNWDIEKISFQYFNEVELIERQLKGLFLSGNDVVLNRTRIELERIKSLLSKIDFGVRINIEKKGLKDIKKVVIEPEQLKELNETKLFYVNRLLSFIDADIPSKPQKSNNKKSPKTKERKIEDYLTDEGKKLLPKLIVKYKNGKPVDLAYMWAAMNDLTTLISEPISNSSELHRLLTNTFGNIGTLQPFSNHMRIMKNEGGAHLNKDGINDKIDEHISVIKSLSAET